jgi:hypothetical protein
MFDDAQCEHMNTDRVLRFAARDDRTKVTTFV